MKKKIMAIVSVLTMAAGLQAFAISSQDLLDNPIMYRVLTTEGNHVVYVDMNSIQGIQTMDYPNSVENITCNVYVEEYEPNISAMDYQNGKLISAIYRGQLQVHANKVTEVFEGSFTAYSKFAQDGKILESIDKNSRQEIAVGIDQNVFTTLHRLAAQK